MKNKPNEAAELNAFAELGHGTITERCNKHGPHSPRESPRPWAEVADAAGVARITVVLGTERVTERGLQITACVINPGGAAQFEILDEDGDVIYSIPD